MGTENAFYRKMDRLGVADLGPGASRGIDNVTDGKILLAYENVLKENYREALKIYAFVEEDNIDCAQTWIYQGICNYNIGDFQKAASYFAKVIVDDNSSYIEKAEWYQIKCFIRQKKRAEAKAKLNRILVLDQHDYKEEAGKLLKKLK